MTKVLAFILLLSLSFAAHAVRRERPLTCPKKATFPGALLIGLGPRHGTELVIIRKSDGAKFVLVSKDKVLVMPSEDFAKTVLFDFNLEAEWEVADGSGVTQPIFNGAGEYQVVVGNSAASTYDGYKCTVEITE
jgi:hypothetical protein